MNPKRRRASTSCSVTPAVLSTRTERPMRRLAIPLIALAAAACGGGSSAPTEEQLNFTSINLISSTGNRTPSFQATGTVPVHYFNKDPGGPHQASSSDCPELNSRLLAFNEDQVTQLVAPKTCNITDTQKPGDANFTLPLTVTAPPPGSGGGGGGGPGHLSTGSS